MFEPHDVSREGRRLSPLHVACTAAGVGFVIVLALLKIYHPFLLARHPERAFMQCCGAALIAFAIGWFAATAKRAQD